MGVNKKFPSLGKFITLARAEIFVNVVAKTKKLLPQRAGRRGS